MPPRTTPGPGKAAYAPYDLVKELCIAVGIVALLAILLTVLFSSPDEKPSTVAQWSRATADQLRRDRRQGARRHERHRRIRAALQPQLRASVQHFLFLHPQRWLGVSHPIDTAQDYVIGPLETVPGNPALQSALGRIPGGSGKDTEGMGRSVRQAAGRIRNGHGRKEDAAQDGRPRPHGAQSRCRRAEPDRFRR